MDAPFKLISSSLAYLKKVFTVEDKNNNRKKKKKSNTG